MRRGFIAAMNAAGERGALVLAEIRVRFCSRSRIQHVIQVGCRRFQRSLGRGDHGHRNVGHSAAALPASPRRARHIIDRLRGDRHVAACCRTCAVAGVCAMHRPPASLMSWRPAVPLLPAPRQDDGNRLRPAGLSQGHVKKLSIGWRWPRGSAGSTEPQDAVFDQQRLCGDDDIDMVRPGSRMPSSTSMTGIVVSWREQLGKQAFARGLEMLDEDEAPCRCRAGIAFRNAVATSSPPADMPMPTIGKGPSLRRGSRCGNWRLRGTLLAGRTGFTGRHSFFRRRVWLDHLVLQLVVWSGSCATAISIL